MTSLWGGQSSPGEVIPTGMSYLYDEFQRGKEALYRTGQLLNKRYDNIEISF